MILCLVCVNRKPVKNGEIQVKHFTHNYYISINSVDSKVKKYAQKECKGFVKSHKIKANRRNGLTLS